MYFMILFSKVTLSWNKNPFEKLQKIKQQKKKIERVRMSGIFWAISKKLNKNKNIVKVKGVFTWIGKYNESQFRAIDKLFEQKELLNKNSIWNSTNFHSFLIIANESFQVLKKIVFLIQMYHKRPFLFCQRNSSIHNKLSS